VATTQFYPLLNDTVLPTKAPLTDTKTNPVDNYHSLQDYLTYIQKVQYIEVVRFILI
jgi:hypothetical protein